MRGCLEEGGTQSRVSSSERACALDRTEAEVEGEKKELAAQGGLDFVTLTCNTSKETSLINVN